MKIGTKSVLFGVHCFFLHPWFVALAWWKLYGFPKQLALWAAFFVHDIGYMCKPNMDGPEGETHPEVGARFMQAFFDRESYVQWSENPDDPEGHLIPVLHEGTHEWHDFVLYHSRYYAKKNGQPFSRLCVADKLAIVITWDWLYWLQGYLSGEIHEYLCRDIDKGFTVPKQAYRPWRRAIKIRMLAWVEQHRNGEQDNVTPVTRHETITS